MAIFRAKENIPTIYPSESRDFQIFLNTLDLVQNSIKFDVDTMTHILSTEDISSNYLDRLKSKVGFFPANDYNDENSLRIVLSAFPYILRYKGSFEGIVRCVNVYLKYLGIRGESKIDIYNSNTDSDTDYTYTVRIGIPSDMSDTTLLTDMLSYVVPTGYFIDIYFFKQTSFEPTQSAFYMQKYILHPTEEENTTVRTDFLENVDNPTAEEIKENQTFSTVQLGTVYTPYDSKEKE